MIRWGTAEKLGIRRAAVLIILCVGARLIALWLLSEDGAHYHESYYWLLATRLLQGKGFGYGPYGQAAFEPLYPLTLVAARALFGNRPPMVLIPQLIISAIGCLYLYKLAWQLTRNSRVAWWSAVLYAFYPYLVRQSIMANEIPLLSTLLILSAYTYITATHPRRVITCGIMFGLTLLTRTVVAPAWLGALFTHGRRFGMRSALLLLVTITSVVSPMLIRNFRVAGVLIPTRSGINLFEGNCVYADTIIPRYSQDLLNQYAWQVLQQQKPATLPPGERGDDLFFTLKAWEFMREHPWRTLRLKLLNTIYLFHPRLMPFERMTSRTRVTFLPDGTLKIEGSVPHPFWQDAIHTISYTTIAFLAIWGCILRRRQLRDDAILGWIAFSFIVVHALYFPHTRLRAPMDFILMFYAACSIAWLLELQQRPRVQ